MLSLHTLPQNPGSSKRSKRVGRGNASGHGTTATRGTKGQRARTGGRKHIAKRSIKALIMHLPKNRGFTALRRPVPGIPLSVVLAAAPSASRIGIADLRAAGVLSRTAYRYKVIGGGTGRKVTVIADSFSRSAKAAIEAAGGEARLATRPTT